MSAVGDVVSRAADVDGDLTGHSAGCRDSISNDFDDGFVHAEGTQVDATGQTGCSGIVMDNPGGPSPG